MQIAERITKKHNIIPHDELWDHLEEILDNLEYQDDVMGSHDPVHLDYFMSSLEGVYAYSCLFMVSDGIIESFFSYDQEEVNHALKKDDERYDEMIEGIIDFLGQNEVFMHNAHDIHKTEIDRNNLLDLFYLDVTDTLNKNNIFYVQVYGNEIYKVCNSPLVGVW